MQNGQDADMAETQEQEGDNQTAHGSDQHDSEQQPTSAPESKSDDDQQHDDDHDDHDDHDGDTFPRVYVERLRSKSAQYRTAANEARQQADYYRQQLWAARVEAAGRLADVTDLPAPDDADPDPDTVQAAIDHLLERKPHLAARRARGDIGQHQQRSSPDGEVSLMGILQRGA